MDLCVAKLWCSLLKLTSRSLLLGSIWSHYIKQRERERELGSDRQMDGYLKQLEPVAFGIFPVIAFAESHLQDTWN